MTVGQNDGGCGSMCVAWYLLNPAAGNVECLNVGQRVARAQRPEVAY